MSIELKASDKAALKRLQDDQSWNVVLRVVAEQIEEWKDEPISGQDAFQELRMLHRRDGKVDGVKELFDKLERKSFE